MTNGYSDVPFVAGSVFGIRGFATVPQADGTWKLKAVTRPDEWEPGENVAECRPLSNYRRAWLNYLPEGHRPGALDCHCGFYATDMQPVLLEGRHGIRHIIRQHSPYLDSPIVGVVEGYGLVSMGSRGFRSEKARIVALVDRYWPLESPFRPGSSGGDPVAHMSPRATHEEKYPDALWYPDVASMLDHHPLTDFRAEAGQAA